MNHPAALYRLPSFLKGVCTPQVYRCWLVRKARAHVKRDRERGNLAATIKDYKQAIHSAVEHGGDRDAYTGRPLRWDLISRYNNAESKLQGRAYKKEFGDLPTIDHVADGLGPADFVICSWRVNDAKNDLDRNEFLDVCRAVLTHASVADQNQGGPNQALHRTDAATSLFGKSYLTQAELGEQGRSGGARRSD
jgi:hypothetical protein